MSSPADSSSASSRATNSPVAHDKQTNASLLRRMAALLYDGFLVFAIWMLLGFIIQLIVGPHTNQLIDGRVQTDASLDIIVFALMVSSCLVYYLGFWMKAGQTTGMIAWRIKTISEQGGPITLQQALIRFALAWPGFFCLGLGYLWHYIDNEGRTFHDRFSGTKVIVLSKDKRPL